MILSTQYGVHRYRQQNQPFVLHCSVTVSHSGTQDFLQYYTMHMTWFLHFMTSNVVQKDSQTDIPLFSLRSNSHALHTVLVCLL